MKKSQKARILEHLKSGKTITPIDALNDFGCMRLADVIFRLKNDGWDIATIDTKSANGKRFASYKLVETSI
tara:strand:- start:451 stop:663 length:213 start_codon:yes stop_codon:yes gene_type:complete